MTAQESLLGAAGLLCAGALIWASFSFYSILAIWRTKRNIELAARAIDHIEDRLPDAQRECDYHVRLQKELEGPLRH